MPVNTDAVLLAAFGATEALLEIVGRRYVVYLRPRALVSCRFPKVELHDLRNADSSGACPVIDIPGMLGALPASISGRAEHWLPTLQGLADAIDVVSHEQRYRGIGRYRGGFSNICFDSLSWLGAFEREASGSLSRIGRPGATVRHRQAVNLTAGGCLGLRVYEGRRDSGASLARVSGSRRDVVLDALAALHGEPKRAKRFATSRVDRLSAGIASPLSHSGTSRK